MTFTDTGLKVLHDYIPLSFANGVEWSYTHRGKADRFDCLYRSGFCNKFLWYAGAFWVVWSRSVSMFEKVDLGSTSNP